MPELRLVHGDGGGLKIAVALALEGDEFVVRFDVRGQASFVNATLPVGSSQWGLWDWDVLELFLAVDASETYYEFQVSPLNQHFELKIFEPRKRFDKEFRSGFAHEAHSTGPDSWAAQMRIHLNKLGWDGRPASLRGGLFAILGDSKKGRSYWALNLPKQEKPDFHQPRHFARFFPDKA